MAITRIQEVNITVGAPVEIDDAINTLRLKLDAGLDWVTHPYLIAQRFVHKGQNKQTYLFPETYSRNTDDPLGKYSYKPLTPDNDFKGMFFAYIGDGTNNTQDIYRNYLTYQVAFIFTVNLKLIDESRLNEGLFTRELIRDARRVFNTSRLGVPFTYKVVKESNDLKTVFREFILNDAEAYNRAPLQCFRFDLEITIQEDCY